MADNKNKKRKKFKAKKTGVGDPTLRLEIQLEDIVEEILDENIPLHLKVNIDNNQVPILDLPFLTLPTYEPIILMAGFSGFLEPTPGDTFPIPTVLTAIPHSDYEFFFEDETGLGGQINDSNNNISYANVTKLSGVNDPLPSSSIVAFQSREGEGPDAQNDGTHVFLANDSNTNNNVITNSYFVSSETDFLWRIDEVNGNYTIFNLGTQQYLGYQEGLGWFPGSTTNTDVAIQWKIENESNGGIPFVIQSVKAKLENATNTYLMATPTTFKGDVQLSPSPSPWYIHVDIFT